MLAVNGAFPQDFVVAGGLSNPRQESGPPEGDFHCGVSDTRKCLSSLLQESRPHGGVGKARLTFLRIAENKSEPPKKNLAMQHHLCYHNDDM